MLVNLATGFLRTRLDYPRLVGGFLFRNVDKTKAFQMEGFN